ncbi:MAG TPA: glycosyltransferase family 1 protein [Planctomycetota bacterium]|nr:glycosyltransferase family 1 protein [Planctomycetota bacterium]
MTTLQPVTLQPAPSEDQDGVKIAIDVSSAAAARRSGVGVALVNILDALAKIDSENEYLACYRLSRLKYSRHLYCPQAGNFRRAIFQEPVIFPRRAHVFHGGDARLPSCGSMPCTATVYDVFSLVRTDFASASFREKKRRRYEHLVRRASRIFAASESTKNDLVSSLSISPQNIIVNHLGVSAEFHPRPAEEVDRIRRKYALPEAYALSVAAFSKRKNIRRVLAAYSALRKSHRIESTLVLAGSLEYWGDSRAALEQSGVADSVILTGFVEDGDLPALYSGARMFIFPSLYEGFGLPALEAMACGVPLIASDRSSLPEIVGTAGLLVDPESDDAIRERMAELDGDPGLRESLAARGLERSKLFSWLKTAERMLATWRELAGA